MKEFEDINIEKWRTFNLQTVTWRKLKRIYRQPLPRMNPFPRKPMGFKIHKRTNFWLLTNGKQLVKDVSWRTYNCPDVTLLHYKFIKVVGIIIPSADIDTLLFNSSEKYARTNSSWETVRTSRWANKKKVPFMFSEEIGMQSRTLYHHKPSLWEN